MATLARIVPIVLRPGAATAGPPRTCAWKVVSVGGQPSTVGVAAYIELEVRIAGEPDARSGYLVSISDVDGAVRAELPGAIERVEGGPSTALSNAWLGDLLRELAARLAARLARAPSRLSLRLTPYSLLALDAAMPDELSLTKRFDFCAAHRLALPELSDAENLAKFGKCSHPAGHGHNYRLDVTVAVPMKAPDAAEWIPIVERDVIERYDHRHLNVDCPEFASVNPSVEHIAQVIHDRLAESLRSSGVRLVRVCVWETAKTWCAVP